MVDKKVLNQKELKKDLANFKKLLRKERVDFESIYLFGSYAKKKQHDFSDIDLAVVSQDFGHDYIEESVLLNRLADKTNILIEAHPLNPNQLKDPYSTFSEEIKKYGVKI